MGTTCSSMSSANGGVPELIAAAAVGDTQLCLAILKDRPDFLCRSPLAGIGNTAMHVAVAHLHCLEAMIKFSQDEAEGEACSSGGQQLCRVQQCLSRVLDITNSQGQTPLMLACRGGHAEAVRLLLLKGADPWMVDKLGSRTALHHAALAGQAVCIKALLTTVRKTSRYIDARTVCGFSPLHCAVAVGSVDAVRALLAHSPNLYACNVFPPPHFRIRCPMQTTVLHMAAIAGNRCIVKELLKNFLERSAVASMNDPRRLQDGDHRLPYQVAECRGHHDLVQLLHPQQRLLGEIFRPEDLKMVPGNIPTLGMLAATVLRTTLMASLDRLAREAVAGYEASAPAAAAAAAIAAATAAAAAEDSLAALEGGGGKPAPAADTDLGAAILHCCASKAVSAAQPISIRPPSPPRCGGADGEDGSSEDDETDAPLLSSSWPSRKPPAGPGGRTCLVSGASGSAGKPTSLLNPLLRRERRSSLKLLASAFEDDPDVLAASVEGDAQTPVPRASGSSSGGGETFVADQADDEPAAAVVMPRGEGGRCSETCGICLDQRPSVAVAGCGHRMCRRCARSLARQVLDRVSPCPFCRRPISDFVTMAP